MRSGTFRIVLVMLLATSMSVVAIGQADHAEPVDNVEDIENVPTPLTLAELLPEGGFDAIDIDCWLRVEGSYKGRPMDIRFTHWSVQAVDGSLVFTYDNGTKGPEKDFRRARTTYSKAGEVVDFYRVTYEHGRKTSEVKGKVVDGRLVTKTTTFDDAGKTQNVSGNSVSLEQYQGTVPSEWFPLIAAYHIRKGSLGYRFARTDYHYNFQHAETTLKDVGIEHVEHEGEQTTAHLLVGERTFGKRDNSVDSRLQYLILDNGELIYLRNQYHGYQFLSKSATRDQISEEFWLPEEKDERGDQE